MNKLNLIAHIYLMFLLLSCSDSILNELNTDTKRSEKVSAESLMTDAIIELGYVVNNTSVNINVLRLVNQYWTEVTYTDEANYIFSVRQIPGNNWNRFYREILKSLFEAKKIVDSDSKLSENQKNNLGAIIEVLNVHTFAMLIETYGDIPYSEALKTNNLLPKYDDAKTVYTDLATRLDAAISTLKNASGSVMSATQDIIYRGDARKWLAYAASLKLKMAVTISDVDNAKAKSMAEATLSDVFQNESESARIAYLSAAPNTNPLYINLTASGRNDFIPAEGLVNAMNELNDPRRKAYFTKINGTYKGGTSGRTNSYSTHSHIHTNIATVPNRPGELLSYAVVKFYLAEGAARGWNMGKTAEELYNEAVTASILEWGGNAGDVATYLAQSSVSYDKDKWKEIIGLQKWIACYGIPHEGWVSLRLLDQPKLAPPSEPESEFPARYFYPQEEQTRNSTNYNDVKQKLGGDTVELELFWDKEKYQNK